MAEVARLGPAPAPRRADAEQRVDPLRRARRLPARPPRGLPRDRRVRRGDAPRLPRRLEPQPADAPAPRLDREPRRAARRLPLQPQPRRRPSTTAPEGRERSRRFFVAVERADLPEQRRHVGPCRRRARGGPGSRANRDRHSATRWSRSCPPSVGPSRAVRRGARARSSSRTTPVTSCRSSPTRSLSRRPTRPSATSARTRFSSGCSRRSSASSGSAARSQSPTFDDPSSVEELARTADVLVVDLGVDASLVDSERSARPATTSRRSFPPRLDLAPRRARSTRGARARAPRAGRAPAAVRARPQLDACSGTRTSSRTSTAATRRLTPASGARPSGSSRSHDDATRAAIERERRLDSLVRAERVMAATPADSRSRDGAHRRATRLRRVRRRLVLSRRGRHLDGRSSRPSWRSRSTAWARGTACSRCRSEASVSRATGRSP